MSRWANNFAEHLDSYPSLGSTVDVAYFHKCMKDLDKDYIDKVISRGECPVQSNGYDCGGQVLANALYYMGDMKLPLAHDCGLWRRLFCAMISNTLDIVSDEPGGIVRCNRESQWKDPS